jgi:hypothetical protein
MTHQKSNFLVPKIPPMSGGRIWGKMGGAQSKTGGKTSCDTQARRGEDQGTIGEDHPVGAS